MMDITVIMNYRYNGYKGYKGYNGYNRYNGHASPEPFVDSMRTCQ